MVKNHKESSDDNYNELLDNVECAFEDYIDNLPESNSDRLNNIIARHILRLEKKICKLIPTKTSNPSEEKGSIKRCVRLVKDLKGLIELGEKVHPQGIVYELDEVLNELHLLANGETPEVDNPVPSLDFYSSENKDKSVIIRKNGIEIAIVPLKADYIIENFVKYLNDGRETDKTEPYRGTRVLNENGLTKLVLLEPKEEKKVGESGSFGFNEDISVVYYGYAYFCPARSNTVYSRKL